MDERSGHVLLLFFSVHRISKESISDKLNDSNVSLVVQSAMESDAAVKGKAADRIANAVVDLTTNGQLSVRLFAVFTR